MDRQDIDALLIGALYGELTPAEEARLTSHLESHPTNRGALDDLKTARQAVRESRIFEYQVDPPQHLSALLLQEAHRRAPKRVVASEENPSWFVRFTRSFIAHPAMAAAATLVLVLGVAGTLYMKKGSDFATKKEMAAAPAEEIERDRRFETQATATPSGPETGLGEGAAAGSAAVPATAPADETYKADLYDKNAHGYRGRADGDTAEGKQLAERPSAKAELAKENASDRWGNQAEKDQANAAPPAVAAAPQKKAATNGIIVGTASPQPKDFEQSKDSAASGAKGNSATLDTLDDSARNNTNTRAGAGGGANAQGVGTASTSTGSTNSNVATVPKSPAQAPGRAPTTTTPAPNGPYAQPPPPPPAPSNDKASVAQKPPSATTSPSGGKAEPKPAEKPSDAKVATKAAPEKTDSATTEQQKRDDSSLLAWAKGQHDATLSLVRKGDCTGAAKRALDVSNRAPEYYAQFMASDRSLKSCMAYINAEREKDAAEKSGKSRAQKRVNADEVQAAPAPSR